MKRHNSVTWQASQMTPAKKRTLSAQNHRKLADDVQPSCSNIKKLLNVDPGKADEATWEFKDALQSNYDSELFSDAIFAISGRVDEVLVDEGVIRVGKYTVRLVDEWRDVDFHVGMNVKISECGCCPRSGSVEGNDITLCDGMMLMIDDVLISVTMFCETFNCLHRTIIKSKIMAIDFNFSHFSLCVGVIMHSIIEECIQKQDFTFKFIIGSLNEQITKNVKLLYACDISTKICKHECIKFVKNILKLKENVYFESVFSIEKRMVSHKYNLVGNIDGVLNYKGMRIPLEIKTGKRMDYRHQAQLIFYLMMMKEKYTNCEDFGILLYVNEFSVRHVKLKHNEVKALLIRRNRIAAYHYVLKNKIENETNFLAHPLLFKPSCKCERVEYCKVIEDIFSGEGFKAEFLKEQWVAINEEEENQKKTVFFPGKYIEQQANNLTIQVEPDSIDTLSNHIEVFSEDRSRLCFGRIMNIENDQVKILLNSSIKLCCYLNLLIANTKNEMFYKTMRYSLLNIAYTNNILDWDGIEQSKMNSALKNEQRIDLSLLSGNRSLNSFESFSDSFRNIDMNPNQSTEKYLELFSQKHTQGTLIKNRIAIPEMFKKEFLELNKDQRSALFLALNCEKYKIIHGFPGTGKSKVITLLIKIMCYLKKKVLLICFTNLAIDNILNKLTVRYYRALKDTTKFETVEALKEYLNGIELVAGTCFSFTDIVFLKKEFDMCVIDEASQQHFLLTLIPISLSKRFVLVGDHLQLKPLTIQNNALKISLFEYLAKKNVSELRMQYRMANNIMRLSNEMFYDKRMIGTGRMGIVEFIELRTVESQICTLISEINAVGDSSVVVLCYFNTTVYALKKYLKCKVETIDRFQGSESDIVVVLFYPIVTGSIMDSRERLNVALTRARNRLILLGNKGDMLKIPLFKEMFSTIKRIM